jgi:hypothetical protein
VQTLQNRMKVQRDSIDCFPPWRHGANRLVPQEDVAGARELRKSDEFRRTR